MTNGDKYVPPLPNFEIYKTKLSHGHEPNQVTTEVLGVKGAPCNVKLLGKFFTRLASDTCNDHRDGIFIPKDAVHQLGPQMYDQVLCNSNLFLDQVATILVNLEYAAWFVVIDPHATAKNDPILLNEHLLRKPWFQ